MRLLSVTLVGLGLMLGSTACSDDDKEGVTAGDVSEDADASVDTVMVDTTPPPIPLAEIVTVQDQVPVAIVNGFSGNVLTEVPANTVSLVATIQGDEGIQYTLNEWRGPGDNVLVNRNWLLTGGPESQGICTACPNRIALSEGDFAAIAPNNPSAEVVPGSHVFILAALKQQGFQAVPTDGDARFTLHAKVTKDGTLPATGILDLNLHFTGAEGWTAETAQVDGNFQAVLDKIRDIYGQVGITIGDLNYYDVDESYRVIENIQGVGSDMHEMFRSAASHSESNRLNLFFVDEISSAAVGGFGVILGISGGIPGPAMIQGTHRGGVVISVKPVEGAPAGVDTTAAHEMGHFLGLFHTSEQNLFGGFLPQIHDPLPDTPENDHTYLMFNTGSGNLLSEWQGRVIRASPWVRHEEVPQ